MKTQRIKNLIKIQEDQSRRNNIHTDGIAELPNENWKNTENKLHQMLYDYFYIIEGVVIEKAHRVEK